MPSTERSLILDGQRVVNQAITSNAGAAQHKGALISHSTVLILAGVLIGLTLSNGIAPALRFQIFAAGAVGVVSYFGITVAHHQRRKKAVKKEHSEILNQLEARVEQHIPTTTPTRDEALLASSAD